jgi:long-chain acyl-CoA synthetase
VPDRLVGEDVKAFVELKAGMSVTDEELIAFTKERLAAYKYPRSIEFRSDLPKNATGKIVKESLAAEAKAQGLTGADRP